MDVDDRQVLEMVVPAYNERGAHESSIHTLHRFLDATFDVPWLLTIADEARAGSRAHEVPVNWVDDTHRNTTLGQVST